MSHPIQSLRRQPPAAPGIEPLAEFEASRRPIVLSYCTWVCEDARAEEAVDSAFARLERELDSAVADEPIKIDRLLREAAREAAAEHVPAAGERSSLVRRIGGRDRACELMPTLLAARASGRLGDADDERLARHLKRCASCRELEHRHVAAERAYDAFLQNGVPEAEELTGVEDAPEADAVVAPAELEVFEVAPVDPEPVDPEPVDPEPQRPGRSRWMAGGAIALLVAAVVAVAAIAITSGSDDTGDSAPVAERRAARATPPPPAPAEPARPAVPRRDATRERLDALGDRMLGPGATGPDVATLQRLLGLPRTGAYDDATRQAVLAFQTANGLNPDGNAGPKTKRLIARRPPAAGR